MMKFICMRCGGERHRLSASLCRHCYRVESGLRKTGTMEGEIMRVLHEMVREGVVKRVRDNKYLKVVKN